MMGTFVALVSKSMMTVISTSAISRMASREVTERIIHSPQSKSTKVNIFLCKAHGRTTYLMVKVHSRLKNPVTKDPSQME